MVLKTTPTPNENGSYGVEVGVRVHHTLCESPSISKDFYTARPLILWHVLGSYF